MKKSFYETLGVKESATPEDIKRAHRKLVKQFHPDQNSAPDASSVFIEVTKAYEVLSDVERRAEYDRLRKINEELRKKKQNEKKPPTSVKQPSQASAPKPTSIHLREQEERLRKLMSVGNFRDADDLARQILADDPQSALSYAALGDIARARGDRKLASKMFAYAAQFDPRNELYLRKHEEMLDQFSRTELTKRGQDNEGRWIAPIVGSALTIIASCFVAMSPEESIFAKGTIISSWTMGLVSMLFFSGAVMGATLCLADYLDRFEFTTAMGRVSPNLVFLLLGVVNLWVAGAIYIVTGGLMRSYSVTLSRLLVALVGVVSVLAIGAAGSHTIDPFEVLLWGGSVVSAGALIGWAFGDGLRG